MFLSLFDTHIILTTKDQSHTHPESIVSILICVSSSWITSIPAIVLVSSLFVCDRNLSHQCHFCTCPHHCTKIKCWFFPFSDVTRWGQNHGTLGRDALYITHSFDQWDISTHSKLRASNGTSLHWLQFMVKIIIKTYQDRLQFIPVQ